MGKGAVVSESLTSFESVSYFNTPSRVRPVPARVQLLPRVCVAALDTDKVRLADHEHLHRPSVGEPTQLPVNMLGARVPIHKFGGDQTAPDLRSTEGWRRVHPELAKASRRRLAPRLPRST